MSSFKKIICLLLLASAFSCRSGGQTISQETTINITKFSVYEKDAKLFVVWATDGSVPTNTWQVQRSNGDAGFSTIALVLGPDPSQPGDSYQYKEGLKDGRAGKFRYRLSHIAVNGTEQFSEIITTAK